MPMSYREMYQPIGQDVETKASQIRLLICDVDGVFSDGRIYLTNSGKKSKLFIPEMVTALKRYGRPVLKLPLSQVDVPRLSRNACNH